jgi:hypothetical protein
MNKHHLKSIFGRLMNKELQSIPANNPKVRDENNSKTCDVKLDSINLHF